MPSLLQRIATGIVTIFVVMLLLLVAVLLADQRVPRATPTATAITVIITLTAPPTPTETATPVPTETPTSTSTPMDTPIPADTDTPAPTATETVPTDTPTPVGTPTQTPTRINACDLTPPDWILYQAQRGDTWDSLASRVGSTPFALQQSNCSNQTIRPADFIYLPFAPPSPTPTDTRTPTRTLTPVPPQPATVTPSPTVILPIISEVIPRQGSVGEETRLFISGRNFGLLDAPGGTQGDGLIVQLIRTEPSIGSFPLQLLNRSSSNLEALIPATLPEGCYNLLVVNPPNPNARQAIFRQAYTNNPDAFPCTDETPTPTPEPTATPVVSLFRCTPTTVPVGTSIECVGRNFPLDTDSLQVELRSRTSGDIGVLRVIRQTSTAFTTEAVFDDLPTGEYVLVLILTKDKVEIADDGDDSIYTIVTPTPEPAPTP